MREQSPRPWWFRRAMYAMVVLVILGAALVWLSTDGAVPIVATVLAALTAMAAVSLARSDPRPP